MSRTAVTTHCSRPNCKTLPPTFSRSSRNEQSQTMAPQACDCGRRDRRDFFVTRGRRPFERRSRDESGPAVRLPLRLVAHDEWHPDLSGRREPGDELLALAWQKLGVRVVPVVDL